jgi:uncharacterized cofD-like protein
MLKLAEKMKKLIKKWWHNLIYSPEDPRFYGGGRIKIVVIGGGTGLSNLLRGLKKYSNDISAIVAMTDSGTSSGQLRKDFGILPPGDIRKCICALANDEELISGLLEFRFDQKANSFKGHTLGNIWLTALTEYFGSFEKAVEVTSEIFFTSGRILPATLEKVDIGAKYSDGSSVVGEAKIPQPDKRIEKIYLTKKVKAYQEALKAIEEADLIIIGPGSLYTSLLPNILIPEIKSKISKNNLAKKIYIVNCSTERGETEGFSVDDHIKVLQKYGSKKLFDLCLVNSRVIKRSEDGSRLGAVNNITTDQKEIAGCQIVKGDLVDRKKPLYHRSKRLAWKLIEIYHQLKD